ncbi:MAG: hypothetical protein ACK52I_28235, partial [Pseudomonadota bacterium]
MPRARRRAGSTAVRRAGTLRTISRTGATAAIPSRTTEMIDSVCRPVDRPARVHAAGARVDVCAKAIAVLAVLGLLAAPATSPESASPASSPAAIANVGAVAGLDLPSLALALEGRTLAEVADDLAAGRVTSDALVEAYLARIAALDAERRAGRVRGPLHGGPSLGKA